MSLSRSSSSASSASPTEGIKSSFTQSFKEAAQHVSFGSHTNAVIPPLNKPSEFSSSMTMKVNSTEAYYDFIARSISEGLHEEAELLMEQKKLVDAKSELMATLSKLEAARAAAIQRRPSY